MFSVLMTVLAAYAGDSVFGDIFGLLSSILILTLDKFVFGIAVNEDIEYVCVSKPLELL